MYGLASSVADPQGLTVSTGYDAAGRPTSSSVSKSGSTLGSVSYQYANGMLKTLSRTTGSSTQSYNFTYDSFGNMKTLKVGGRTLAEYTYGDKNGQLERQTYGNGDYTSFQYDNLNRTTGTTTSSGDSYHYSYTQATDSCIKWRIRQRASPTATIMTPLAGSLVPARQAARQTCGLPTAMTMRAV